jgi:zinc resistance-associated protein
MRNTRRGIAAVVLCAALAGGAAVAFAADGSPFARGEGGPPRAWSAWQRFSAEDRAAFADARIAALHAGLKLNPDQEKLWPPVEGAMRDFAKLRREQREARRARGPDGMREDAPAALRAMADAQGARADALRKLADAAQPLYATLDEGQKRRAMVLARPMGPRHGPHAGPLGGPGRHRGFGPGDE